MSVSSIFVAKDFSLGVRKGANLYSWIGTDKCNMFRSTDGSRHCFSVSSGVGAGLDVSFKQFLSLFALMMFSLVVVGMSSGKTRTATTTVRY